MSRPGERGEDEAPLTRLLRAARLAWLRRSRRRERGCVRCGAPSDGMCPACGARVCAACSVLSIETGSAVAICLSCSGAAAGGGSAPRPPVRPLHLFRTGASLLLLGIGAVAALALQREGWPGAWRVILTVLHPSVLLGLVPLALVLGAVVSLGRRLLVGRLGP
ncbi:MAG: hypothetical protein ACREQ9_01665 [Candidatus Binatia bacterium]